MTARWPLLVAVLVYVTLDLSLPSMPGAFVFDADDTVESIQRARIRDAVDVAVARGSARQTTVVVTRQITVHRPVAPLRPRGQARTLVGPPQTTASRPPSDDSH